MTDAKAQTPKRTAAIILVLIIRTMMKESYYLVHGDSERHHSTTISNISLNRKNTMSTTRLVNEAYAEFKRLLLLIIIFLSSIVS
jgi:hypothetical protein